MEKTIKHPIFSADDVRVEISKRLKKKKLSKKIKDIHGADVEIVDPLSYQLAEAFIMGIVEAKHSIKIKTEELKKLGFTKKEIDQHVADAMKDFEKTLG